MLSDAGWIEGVNWINEYILTLFLQEEDDENLYRKYQEQHFQKAYTLETMQKLLQKAGLVFEAAYDAYTKDSVQKRVSVSQ